MAFAVVAKASEIESGYMVNIASPECHNAECQEQRGSFCQVTSRTEIH
jgi:hypothetical protein